MLISRHFKKRLESTFAVCNCVAMGKTEKFASQLDGELLRSLREHAEATGRSISALLDDAVREYLERAHVRPAFRSAMDEVLENHDELLKRLAR
jgi:predicted transcriptional regulator